MQTWFLSQGLQELQSAHRLQYCLNIWPSSPKRKGVDSRLPWLFVLTYSMILLFVQPLNKLPLNKVGRSFKHYLSVLMFRMAFCMAWGDLFHKSCRLKDEQEEMVAISSSLCRKLFQDRFFSSQHSPSLLWQKKSKYPDFEVKFNTVFDYG